jgi:hypothetical protein
MARSDRSRGEEGDYKGRRVDKLAIAAAVSQDLAAKTFIHVLVHDIKPNWGGDAASGEDEPSRSV